MQELLQLTDGISETNQLIIAKKFTMQEKNIIKIFFNFVNYIIIKDNDIILIYDIYNER